MYIVFKHKNIHIYRQGGRGEPRNHSTEGDRINFRWGKILFFFSPKKIFSQEKFAFGKGTIPRYPAWVRPCLLAHLKHTDSGDFLKVKERILHLSASNSVPF